jgi:hypothetical protein
MDINVNPPAALVCPHCGGEITASMNAVPITPVQAGQEVADDVVQTPPATVKLSIADFDETLVAEIAKLAVPEIMVVIKPLIDKLQEALKQQQQGNAQQQSPLGVLGNEKQLESLTLTAMDRIKLQEQRIATRLAAMKNGMNKRF